MADTSISTPDNNEELIQHEKKINITEYSEFAQLCTFFCHFGEKLGLLLTFPRINRLLSCETDSDLQSLTTLLVKLLNKNRFRTQLNRWQPSLGRFLQKYAYNEEDLASVGASLNAPSPSADVVAMAPEHSGLPSAFFSLAPVLRLRVVLFCCETQFQLNTPFKEKVKSFEAELLRPKPFGWDIFGNAYWFLVDCEFNFLLYKESSSDETLSLASDAFNTLAEVIEELRNEKYEKTPISTLYFSDCVGESLIDVTKPKDILDATTKPEDENITETIDANILKSDLEEVDAESKPLEETPVDLKMEPDGKGNPPPTALSGPEETTRALLSHVKAEDTIKPEEPEKSESPSPAPPPPIEAPNEAAATDDADKQCLGLRRSGRHRKQVEFLSMESFSTPKTRSKKNKAAEDQDTAQPRVHKKEKKKHRRGGDVKMNQKNGKLTKKGRRKGKNGKMASRNGGASRAPWSRSGSCTDEQDEENWTDAVEELLNGEPSETSSLSDSRLMPEKDWLEQVESDFDQNADGDNDDDDGCRRKTGRNLQRHARPSVADEIDDATSTPCQICTKTNRPEWLLLCDSCDLGFHAQCLRPVLHTIPEGDWFCPRCLHAKLVTALAEQLTTLQGKRKKVDSATRMQERLNFVNIRVSNILRDEKTRPRESAATAEESNDEGSYGSADRPRRNRRPRSYGSSVSGGESSSDGDDETEEEDDEEAEEEDSRPTVRSTRHREVRYNVNAAFEQLDEVLTVDEKYASEIAERREAKEKQHRQDDVEGREEEEEYDRPPTPLLRGATPLRTSARKKGLTSSSSDSGGDETKRGRATKRRKRVSSGSEDFRPSSADEDEEEEEEEGGARVSEDFDAVGSSDESWSATVSRKRRSRRPGRHSGSSKRRKRRSGRGSGGGAWLSSRPRSGGRARRRIPRFEGPSSDDDEGPRTRRSARSRVNYREVESGDDLEGGETAPAPPPIAPPVNSPSARLKHPATKGNANSGSEYAPSDREQEEDDEEEDPEEVVVANDPSTDVDPPKDAEEEEEVVAKEGAENDRPAGGSVELNTSRDEPVISEDDEEEGGALVMGVQTPEIDEHTSSPDHPKLTGGVGGGGSPLI